LRILTDCIINFEREGHFSPADTPRGKISFFSPGSNPVNHPRHFVQLFSLREMPVREISFRSALSAASSVGYFSLRNRLADRYLL
jgi:hypothetical protein